MKTQDLRAFVVDPHWTQNGGFRRRGPWLDPASHVGNPRAFSRPRAVASPLQEPNQNMLLRQDFKIAIEDRDSK
jgi:hypothetical protein